MLVGVPTLRAAIRTVAINGIDPVSLLGMIMIPPLLALERPIHFDSNASQLWAEPQRMAHGVTLLLRAAKGPPRASYGEGRKKENKVRKS